MIRQPFTPAELGIDDESLVPAAEELERYAEQTRLSASSALVASILDAVEAEPAPRRGWLGGVAARGGTLHRSFAMAVTAAVLVAAVGIGFLFGRLVDGPAPGVGSSPSPVVVTASPTPTPTPTVSPTPTPSPSLSPSPTSSSQASESPGQSAEPSASESDDSGGNSGPGGGDDNSGPGGGD